MVLILRTSFNLFLGFVLGFWCLVQYQFPCGRKTTCGASSFSKYCMIWYNCQGDNFGFVNLISYCFKYYPGTIHAYHTWFPNNICMKIVLQCILKLTLDALISILFSNFLLSCFFLFCFILELGTWKYV